MAVLQLSAVAEGPDPLAGPRQLDYTTVEHRGQKRGRLPGGLRGHGSAGQWHRPGILRGSILGRQHPFENWRARKGGREPIPTHLWAAAVRLCRDYPLTQVSRELRLSFYDLKKRLPNAIPVRFTELTCSAIAGSW
jgi:hypothetical protein